LDQSQLTRLIQGLKGTSRLANPKARLVVSEATTREQFGGLSALGAMGSVNGRASAPGVATMVSITDPSGNLYAMVGVVGAGQGSTIK
jgi:hypothetical protein